ncbi:hypothetical protein KZ829_08740 [Actinoplanes hulinensis]|uniref:Uncharacterized protein n=1 Tax=Actinoplanes hulinensis TaxID=1144547 RepID=A0ABS7AYK7_9ACTN|nr:hypothetical protein [Actinoplanes hulinensis]MBW6433820.1 hypothetical protein [Actinoplanes hulinensis]
MAVGLLAVYAVACFIPGIAPFARYPLYVVKCGGRPIIATTFAAANSYWVPGDPGYTVHFFVDDYFCTETEAQAAGYRRRAL